MQRNPLYALAFAFFFLTGMVLFGSPRASAQTATSTASSTLSGNVTCTQYTLIWTDPDMKTYPDAIAGGEVMVGEGGLTTTNPIDVTNGSAPAVPTALKGQADWQCTETTGTTGTLPVDSSSTEGTELCIKAAQLAAEYGSLNSLDHIQQNVEDSVISFLGNQIKSFTGLTINLDAKSLVQQGVSQGGQFVESKFNEIFANPMKQQVQDQANAIIAKGKQQLQQLADQYAKQLASKATNLASNALSGLSAVPTNPQGQIITNTDLTNQHLADVIAEQRHQEVVANTRQQCQLLYTKTNETIKNSLLFQLSNQIVDWIQNGQQPQFIKNPGKFLSDTAILAVNRSISQLAPNLCSSFRDQVVVQIPGYSEQTNPFYQPVTCTINQVVSNVEDFYNNFQNGGWLAYSEVWQPQNNYFGASMLANSLVTSQATAATQAAQNDLNQGNGFASQVQCTEWVLYSPVTTGGVTQSIMNSLELVGNTYYAPDYSNVQGATADGNPPAVPATAPADSHWQCNATQKTTPGTVAANLTQQASASTLTNLNQTSDVEAFMSTIQDAIVNKLVKGGVTGLKSLLKGLPQITQ